jgi:glycosyltransferase involved in cell wall biosynthesis
MSLTAQEIQLISDSGLFDAAWYAEKYPDVGLVGLDPLEHFLRIGIHAGREPGPLFDNKHYCRQLEKFDSGRKVGIPLCNYLKYGWFYGLSVEDYVEKNESLQGCEYSANESLDRSIFQFFNNLFNCFTDKDNALNIILFGNNADRTGGGIVQQGIIEGLNAVGANVVIVLKEGGSLCFDYKNKCNLIIESEFARYFTSRDFKKELKKYLKESKSGFFVILNTVVTVDFIESIDCLKNPTICLIHEMPESIDHFFGGDSTMKKIAENVSKMIFPSQYAMNSCIARYELDAARCETITPGIDFESELSKSEARKQIRQKLGLREEVKIVLSCGTIESRKGFDLFIEIAEKVANIQDGQTLIPTCFVWIGNIGEESLYKKCVEKINQIGRNNIKIVPNCYPVVDFFKASDCFLLTSRLESLSMVSLEAASVGIPVVLFEGVTGAEEILFPHGKAMRIPAFDTHEMAFQCIQILGENGQILNEKDNLLVPKYTWSNYSSGILNNFTNFGKSLKCDKKIKILVIGYGCPPIQGRRSEGTGLRNWGMAKTLKRLIPNSDVVLAYKVNIDEQIPNGIYDGVNLVLWRGDEIQFEIKKCDFIILSFCMGSDSTWILDQLNGSQKAILDCYVPIFTEVCARDSLDKENEAKNYARDIQYWNKALLRGDYFLVANDSQVIYYQGVLSSIGKLTPLNYGNRTIIKAPYGYDDNIPVAGAAPFNKKINNSNAFKILWFGGVYPWFDIDILINAVSIVNNLIPCRLAMVGALNPFNSHPDFIAKYDRLVELINKNNLSDIVTLEDWVDYDKRADWYLDSDIIITLNKTGFENSLAWRTRLVDYVWSGVPLATNGGDPLGEDLIKHGAAFRIDITTHISLTNSLVSIIEDKVQLSNVRLAIRDYRSKLFWRSALLELADVISS